MRLLLAPYRFLLSIEKRTQYFRFRTLFLFLRLFNKYKALISFFNLIFAAVRSSVSDIILRKAIMKC